jgi:ribonuclease VapC
LIVDTSALVAIILGEQDAVALEAALAAAPACRISAGTYIELSIVIDRAQNALVSRRLDQILDEARFVIEPVTASQARIAREAYRDFGKGSGHPARLNLGDCFAYALARELGEPLLFKGDDFNQTDIESALGRGGGGRLSELVARYEVGATSRSGSAE